MDEKKLIEYTKWLFKSTDRRQCKQIVKAFLKQNPDFFDEPDPETKWVIKNFDGYFEGGEPMKPDKLIGYKLIKEYPLSPEIGTFQERINIYSGGPFARYPEFWEPVYKNIDEPEPIPNPEKEPVSAFDEQDKEEKMWKSFGGPIRKTPVDEPLPDEKSNPWDELFQSKEIQYNIAKDPTPHRCPICNGTKIVMAGFYDSTSGFSTSNTSDEPCRQCAGTGIIWS